MKQEEAAEADELLQNVIDHSKDIEKESPAKKSKSPSPRKQSK